MRECDIDLTTQPPYLRCVKMVKANLCLFTGSKSFLPKTAGLAEERTPTRRSVNAKKKKKKKKF